MLVLKCNHHIHVLDNTPNHLDSGPGCTLNWLFLLWWARTANYNQSQQRNAGWHGNASIEWHCGNRMLRMRYVFLQYHSCQFCKHYFAQHNLFTSYFWCPILQSLICIDSLTAIGPYMAHRFSWTSLFKLNNFLNFYPFATFNSSKIYLSSSIWIVALGLGSGIVAPRTWVEGPWWVSNCLAFCVGLP